MKKVLVSACLLGEPVRFDGGSKKQDSAVLARWQREGRLVVVCPEMAGGLPAPRPPAELQTDGRVVDVEGRDVTEAFTRGAEAALALVRAHGVALAVLKQRSPSCGTGELYDGSFTGTRTAGDGVTAARLRGAGLPVFDETQLEDAAALLAQLDAVSEEAPGQHSA